VCSQLVQGTVAIDPVVPAADAILEAFYPSVRGAKALNMALFGDANRFGRMPVTMYNKEYTKLGECTVFFKSSRVSTSQRQLWTKDCKEQHNKKKSGLFCVSFFCS
jgi:hypothetical protein